ncbi:MAG: RloB family protein [Paludibacter sp.]|nr:RloB family protein [Paludibacter sp.]
MARPKQPVRKQIVIIGDGKTESIYVDSLKDAFKDKLLGYKPKPLIPKHSSVAELKKLIEANIDYDKVMCVVDMDTKLRDSKEMTEYQKLKQKYRKSKKVIFYETHPCTELWFYYHFQYTTSEFGLFEPELKRQLERKIPGYEKKSPFCTHQHIIKCGGNFDTAVANGRRSIDSKDTDDRNYTYSEMVHFFEEIGVVEKLDDKK